MAGIARIRPLARENRPNPARQLVARHAFGSLAT